MALHFGELAFDSARHEVRRAGRPVAISPKAFRLLELLIEERSRAVSSEEIRAKVWPGIFVAATGLARLVNELRRAIGDTGRERRWVRTVHGFGYSFCAQPSGGDSPVRRNEYSLMWGNRRILLGEGETLIGRAPDVAVSIASARVSRHHARITVVDGRATLEDLGSKNGTFLAGRRITGASELASGDEIEVGPVCLTLRRHLPEQDTTEGD